MRIASPGFEHSAERVIACVPRGNVFMQLTGTAYGLTYDDWQRLIDAAADEWAYDTPRCLRSRTWNAADRLARANGDERFCFDELQDDSYKRGCRDEREAIEKELEALAEQGCKSDGDA